MVNPLKGLTEGSIVHFVLPTGAHRPAIVTTVEDAEMGVVTLNVNTNPQLDNTYCGNHNLVTEHSVFYSKTQRVNTWHWIEPV